MFAEPALPEAGARASAVPSPLPEAGASALEAGASAHVLRTSPCASHLSDMDGRHIVHQCIICPSKLLEQCKAGIKLRRAVSGLPMSTQQAAQIKAIQEGRGFGLPSVFYVHVFT